jgi:hypothetical protein
MKVFFNVAGVCNKPMLYSAKAQLGRGILAYLLRFFAAISDPYSC